MVYPRMPVSGSHSSLDKSTGTVQERQIDSVSVRLDGVPTTEGTAVFRFPPWHPFRKRLDFEIAKIIQAVHMKEKLVSRTISFIQQAVGDTPARRSSSDFTFSGLPDFQNVWDHAREIRTSKVRHTQVISLGTLS